MSNLEIVASMYEAFNRGDIQAIIDQTADNVAWESWKDNYAQKAGVPYLRAQSGKQGVADFFAEVAKMGITRLDILSMMEGGNQVAVELELDAAKFSDEEIHLWTLNEAGKITRFRHYIDTAKQIAANEKAAGSASA
jgi:uncharacterized protein